MVRESVISAIPYMFQTAAKVARHGRYITFQLADVAVS